MRESADVNQMHLPRPAQVETDDSIDLLALLRTLWRGKLVILAAALSMAIFAGIYAWRIATPIYSATSVVMLESREAGGMGLESVLGGLSSDTSTVNTEVEVLRGRMLMGRVVDALELTKDPEFNSALRPEGFVAGLRSSLGLGGEKKILAPEEQAARERDNTVTALLSQLTISNKANSLVFQINVESEAPDKAQLIADTIARLYIDDQLRVRFEATDAAIDWLTSQGIELKAEFEKAEEEVRNFRSSTNVIDAESLVALDRQLKDTKRRLEALTGQIADLRLRIARVEGEAEPMALALATGEEGLITLASRMEAGNALSRQEFDQALERVMSRFRQDEARLVSQEKALREAEGKLAADFENQSRDMVQLEQLTRNAEASRMLFDQFQAQLKETLAQQGLQKADSRILSFAVLPSVPSAPRKSLILTMGLILGGMIGVGIVLLREMTANRIRSAQELEAVSGLPVFAQIPLIPVRNRRGALDYLGKNPASAAAEAVRNLRVSIMLSAPDKQPQVLMITSSVPGEGKTTTALSLAQNMTLLGRKVLLIEGDVRLSPLGEYFQGISSSKAGVAEVIAGNVALADAVQRIEGVGDILPESKAKVNAADLFTSERFAAVIAEARRIYDIIIIDTPPVLVVPDARIIAQVADAVVFVVHWDSTSRDQVEASMQQLALVNIRPAGMVLSRVDPKGMRRYGYGDSYGAYSGYGAKYYTGN